MDQTNIYFNPIAARTYFLQTLLYFVWQFFGKTNCKNVNEQIRLSAKIYRLKKCCNTNSLNCSNCIDNIKIRSFWILISILSIFCYWKSLQIRTCVVFSSIEFLYTENIYFIYKQKKTMAGHYIYNWFYFTITFNFIMFLLTVIHMYVLFQI